ncbi:MAG TPA: PEFG-CTERM sorting domain-containing protein, partial [Nitrosopumilaceae archaeon]|nr:PEFG-CTERM sorting domain-containing protein [Nitrosopumilaceae archaeon]
FFVLIDGEEVDFEEEATSNDRTLTIHFQDGAEEIEIIGTFIVPEFGAIAALVLAVAIISIIALSAKTRLRLMPKY